jgi:DNA-binding MarR family transcriptional regulator
LDKQKPLDHIGWDLWQASQAWKRLFVAGMVRRGHGWFAEARGNLVHLIGPEGARQGDIVQRSQMTKQAVQQFIDELEEDGIVNRSPDPSDARANRVKFTAKGLRALEDANAIKGEVETLYARLVGRAELAQLKATLDKINKASH